MNTKHILAFTLVEILVAVSIIAVLAALLFPLLVSAEHSAQKANCISNLRQISHSWQMYNQDYDEMTPGGSYVRFADKATGNSIDGKRYTPLWVLLPYCKSETIYICPTRLGWNFSTTNPALDTHRPRLGSYASNYELVEIGLAGIDEPARMITFCDSYNPWQNCVHGCQCPDGASSFIWDRIGRGCYQGDCSRPTDWHNKGICTSYADGHTKWKPLGGIFYKNWSLSLSESDRHYNQPITVDW